MRTLILLSGGMDSATVLAKARHDFGSDGLGTLSVIYGQRHIREIGAARRIAEHYGVPHEVFDMTPRDGTAALFTGSSLTDDVPVPHGAYDAPSMKATVVPNRNMILLALAGAYAISHGYDRLAYGAHAGDHTIYPDCRPVFVDAMKKALFLCDWKSLDLWVPFLMATKGEITRQGLALKVPYELTWTCYEGGEVACGKCGSCVERIEAFHDNNTKDPIHYAPA